MEPLPAGQNHGSISSVYTTGSLADGNLVVYAIDEDINSAHFGGTQQGDRNSLWKWTVGSGGDANGANYNGTPTQLTAGVPGANQTLGLIGDFPAGGIVVDLAVGPNGNFYMSQNRSAGGQPGIIATDPTGAIIFNSLLASAHASERPGGGGYLHGCGRH